MIPNLLEIQNSEDFFLQTQSVLVHHFLDATLGHLNCFQKSCQLLSMGLIKLNNLDLLVVLPAREPAKDKFSISLGHTSPC